MQLPTIPFTVTDWNAVQPVEHRGVTGTSFWQIFESGGLRARIVRYSPGFRSDHWCPRGHVLLVLDGDMGISLKDGRTYNLRPGMSFQAGDDEANPHLNYSEKGATVFIVD